MTSAPPRIAEIVARALTPPHPGPAPRSGNPDAGDDRDRPVRAPERQASLLQHFQRRIAPLGRRQIVLGDGQIQLCEVKTPRCRFMPPPAAGSGASCAALTAAGVW
jgi:hypothetical protein